VFHAAFIKLQLGFVFFWRKNMGTKAAHKMSLKLTAVVNLINILEVDFARIFLSQKIT